MYTISRQKPATRALDLPDEQEDGSVPNQPMTEIEDMTPREKEGLGRVARGEEVDADTASQLARRGLVWRTGWGKLALSQAGVSALHDMRNAGNP